MARVITHSAHIRRDARTADRPGPADASPFRSAKAGRRIVAARAMINKRKDEIAKIEKALERAETPKIQRILTTRLLASKNNLAAWETYIVGFEQEPRAVIIPA